jgi:hypothetical protein
LESGLSQLTALVGELSKKLDQQAAPSPDEPAKRKKERISNETLGLGAAAGGAVATVVGDVIATTTAGDAAGILGGVVGVGVAWFRKRGEGKHDD